METIVAAAIYQDGLVFVLERPKRHGDVILAMKDAGVSLQHSTHIQGFLTSDGRFVERAMARLIAIKAKQLLPRATDSRELFSEDVW